ncbi:MAG: hypothetical protein A3D59_04815 [Candidatus Wildermuthbacteria bacterium RIFCSPHIGHO2_02_FULL_47_17]|uniref:Arginine--tRNA ligase n=1 Tax=Candidatus Wildermuthbacteria bacterium RIFCSPHIGHO2_02_FULL_47_17 TaxID=1802452 RepID=A0A1G2R4H2_9BACT|nr:MAG: hypothetical protein A3D59_04815 [Candidatus Wildermuthbacteria bacterium RIFCSPHIGHO2_02_FULL_47_17]
MIREQTAELVRKTIKDLQKEKIWPEFEMPEILVERPEDFSHGDYSISMAFQLSKIIKKSPTEIASLLSEKLKVRNEKMFGKVAAAEPGFVNFFLSKEFLQKQVAEILKQKEKFGQVNIGRGEKVNVEFISANPTGPLHVGNARGGFCGDVLANILAAAGHKTTREYYVNDKGRQVYFLEHSLNPEETPVYKNIYINALQKRGIRDAERATKFIIAEIKKTIAKMGISYDVWFFESDLYKNKEDKKALELLSKKGLTEEKEGGIWFKSKQEFADDKDRVLHKKTEERPEGNTYFLSEIAYLNNKFKRGFKRLIIFLGAEHHGYVPRIKAATEALGYDKESVQPIIMQLVHLLEDGKEVKMSKRTGIYVTIDELLDEVGLDVARFFFLMRGYGSHLNFDLDLAKQQSEKNPVYYVQYAHARICSILAKSKNQNSRLRASFAEVATKAEQGFGGQAKSKINLKSLTHPSELALIKQLIRLPEIIEDISRDYQVQRLPQYAIDLATAFHQFYRDCRVISEDKNLTRARLALVFATKTVLKNTLALMGVSAPEKM